ncbi:hypothetical protein ILYODFUR_032192 [Ilyodon furcidens]|uniref:Uncharacterized protein n=1 Tax=Ilyodon furcidens TaxID=33524 RepID=A0ABV0ULB4_9TELE
MKCKTCNKPENVNTYFYPQIPLQAVSIKLSIFPQQLRTKMFFLPVYLRSHFLKVIGAEKSVSGLSCESLKLTKPLPPLPLLIRRTDTVSLSLPFKTELHRLFLCFPQF